LNNNTAAYELYPHQFYCPKCFVKRPYTLKPVSVKTSFYYIPLFENEALNHVVECKAYKRGFDPRILKPYYQNLFKLAGAARRETLEASSLKILKKELAAAGIKEEYAEKLIMLAQA
jgi:hypothetical protein